VSIRMFTITIWHVAKVVSSHHGEPAKVPNVYFGAFLLFKSALDSAQAHCRGLRPAAGALNELAPISRLLKRYLASWPP
jgi:hypothetical protein